MQDAVTRLVFSIGDKPQAPLFIDNLRLERDTETAKVLFDGLWAFDVGPAGSPVMEGFTPLDPGKTYTKGRGYGWKNAHFWRAFDALQPDPLYQDFICVEKGGLAIDVPNGKYHVFVNMDSPSGFWGEFQRYRKRALILEGRAPRGHDGPGVVQEALLPLLGHGRPARATTRSTSIRSRISTRSNTTSRSATAS